MYIQDSADVPEYYREIVMSAYQSWQRASEGLVRFEFVEDSANADMKCFFKNTDNKKSIGTHAFTIKNMFDAGYKPSRGDIYAIIEATEHWYKGQKTDEDKKLAKTSIEILKGTLKQNEYKELLGSGLFYTCRDTRSDTKFANDIYIPLIDFLLSEGYDPYKGNGNPQGILDWFDYDISNAQNYKYSRDYEMGYMSESQIQSCENYIKDLTNPRAQIKATFAKHGISVN